MQFFHQIKQRNTINHLQNIKSSKLLTINARLNNVKIYHDISVFFCDLETIQGSFCHGLNTMEYNIIS